MKREPTGQTFKIDVLSAFISATFFVCVWLLMLALIASQGRPAEFIKSLTR